MWEGSPNTMANRRAQLVSEQIEIGVGDASHRIAAHCLGADRETPNRHYTPKRPAVSVGVQQKLFATVAELFQIILVERFDRLAIGARDDRVEDLLVDQQPVGRLHIPVERV
jgi:hypothetical protein